MLGAWRARASVCIGDEHGSPHARRSFNTATALYSGVVNSVRAGGFVRKSTGSPAAAVVAVADARDDPYPTPSQTTKYILYAKFIDVSAHACELVHISNTSKVRLILTSRVRALSQTGSISVSVAIRRKGDEC